MILLQGKFIPILPSQLKPVFILSVVVDFPYTIENSDMPSMMVIALYTSETSVSMIVFFPENPKDCCQNYGIHTLCNAHGSWHVSSAERN
uniref:Uncharacterized protein n=1 Tax=Arion vulgaris TaxID=1028688 RepID=A0A0B7BUW1_9EUPU